MANSIINNNFIKIFSLNCMGVGNKLPVLRDICHNYDLICLQETWLTPDNLNFLDTVSGDFCSHSISAVCLDQPLIGRPHGGLSILWRRSLGLKCSIKLYEDPRILGINLGNSTQNILILNIYLPYFSQENYDNYLNYVGKISSIIQDHDHNDIMIIGDFNANIDSPFFHEWDNVREFSGMTFVDVDNLAASSYTHINNASYSTSWIDHCLVTATVKMCVENIEILYDDYLSDHVPFTVTLTIDNISPLSGC